MLADMTVWVEKGSHMKESNFLPGVPLRRNGGRIFHQLILVTLQNLLLRRRWLEEWRKYDVPEWTKACHVFEPSRGPRPLGILQAHCIPDAWRRRKSNRLWVQKWDGTETVDAHKWKTPVATNTNDETPRRCGNGLTLCLVSSAHVTAKLTTSHSNRWQIHYPHRAIFLKWLSYYTVRPCVRLSVPLCK